MVVGGGLWKEWQIRGGIPTGDDYAIVDVWEGNCLMHAKSGSPLIGRTFCYTKVIIYKKPQCG